MAKADKDQRQAFQRDRDRILYSPAFRRLAGVTQVVAPDEGRVFHNRLTHTVKVAQVGRRIAEMLLDRQPAIAKAHYLDADVVETACLAHDLGHPPFGHIAEEELDHLMRHVGKCFDGYEGNAQSFRVVTRLSPRDESAPGLNLTRATLNAVLKYPWFRDSDVKSERKWGAYRSEKEEFDFARFGFKDRVVGIEAQLMTWADDIAYAVHDTEDFFRAGLIPLDRLGLGETGEADAFLVAVFNRWKREGRHFSPDEEKQLREAFSRIGQFFPVKPYKGRREDRFRLYDFSSSLIANYVKATKILEKATADGNLLDIDADLKNEVRILHEMTWHYVIHNPALASQQYGQRKIIRTLFEVFTEAVDPASPKWHILPPMFQSEMELLEDVHGRHAIPSESRWRVVADTIASMTDIEALRVFQRVTGLVPGSVLDPIVM